MKEVKYYSNAWGAAKAEFILNRILSTTILAIANNKKDAELLYNDLLLFNKDRKILFFPEYDHEPLEEVRIDTETFSARTNCLLELSYLDPRDDVIVVTTPYALIKKITPQDEFKKYTKHLNRNDIIDRAKFIDTLDAIGYLPVEVVTGEGEFCIRGGIVDIFPVTSSLPMRLEFFDDELEYIFSYDPNTQKRIADVDSFILLPASEILLTNKAFAEIEISPDIKEKIENFGKFAGHHWLIDKIYPMATLCDYLPSNWHSILFEEDWKSVFERVLISVGDGAVNSSLPKPQDAFISMSDIKKTLEHSDISIISDFITNENIQSCRYRSIKSRFSSTKGNIYYDLTQALNEINRLQGDGFITIACVESERFNALIEKFCIDHEIKLQEIKKSFEASVGSLNLYKQRVSGGFINEKDKIAIITDEEIFGFVRKKNKAKSKEVFDTVISDLEQGDFVVHVDYGIGVYNGLKHMEMGGIEGDYLDIAYDNGEILYVPLERISQIQKYIGIGDAKPKLSNLSTNTWNKLKDHAKKQAAKIAQDLLKLYAERKTRKGFAFKEGGEVLAKFEESFEFDETEDQLAAISDVYNDMEKENPMERLICGDVGFGKTEVAMRAACKAVIAGKQVAVLVPTTVLARQHYKTFKRRFAALPVKIDYISRMRTSSEVRNIKHDLENGSIDILIGTHKILSTDVRFKDLCLLIIDEEQRFGVGHKEKIAAMRSNIDVLSLSATPIPRTLQLSLSGIREISVIETPPSNRVPVSVKVIQHGEDVRRAMIQELERNGQIFFLHNRVQDMGSVVDYVKNLVPHARIASAHGRTTAKELEKILVDFYNGDLDVLISTTIIENGIDIPNVNAIFIDKASHFGLSQLYQLKGRVGRSNLRGYCYLIVDNMQGLSPVAKKRLSIIQQLSDLGSGLKIAMYDLQLRGAGDILGAAQSGFVTKVGYELFIKMIAEAVSELQKDSDKLTDTEIITQFPYYIAADYVEDPRIRLDYYRIFSKLSNRYSMEELFMELEKHFGEVRTETINLGYIMLIKNICSELKVAKAGIYPKMLRLTFARDSSISPSMLKNEADKRRITYRFAGEFEFVAAFEDENKTLSGMEDFLSSLNSKKVQLAESALAE